MTSQGYIPSAGIIEILEDFRAQPFLGHEKIILEISGSIYLTSHSLPNRSQTQSTAPRLSALPLQSPQGLRSLLKKQRKTSLTQHGYIPAPRLLKYSEDFRPSGENHPGVRHRVSIAPTHLLRTIFAPETAGYNHPPSLTPDSFSIRCTAHPPKNAKASIPTRSLRGSASVAFPTYICYNIAHNQSEQKTKKFFFPLNLF